MKETIKIDENKLPEKVQHEYRLKKLLRKREDIKDGVQGDFLNFVKYVWREFVEGSHHRHIADKFNQLASGEINRLIINMPPRHTKSEFASCLLPAWMVGLDPKLKIIQATHTA